MRFKDRRQQAAVMARIKNAQIARVDSVGYDGKRIDGADIVEKGYTHPRWFMRPQNYDLYKIKPEHYRKVRYKGEVLIG